MEESPKNQSFFLFLFYLIVCGRVNSNVALIYFISSENLSFSKKAR